MNLGVLIFWLLASTLILFALFTIASTNMVGAIVIGVWMIASLLWGILDEE